MIFVFNSVKGFLDIEDHNEEEDEDEGEGYIYYVKKTLLDY